MEFTHSSGVWLRPVAIVAQVASEVLVLCCHRDLSGSCLCTVHLCVSTLCFPPSKNLVGVFARRSDGVWPLVPALVSQRRMVALLKREVVKKLEPKSSHGSSTSAMQVEQLYGLCQQRKTKAGVTGTGKAFEVLLIGGGPGD